MPVTMTRPRTAARRSTARLKLPLSVGDERASRPAISVAQHTRRARRDVAAASVSCMSWIKGQFAILRQALAHAGDAAETRHPAAYNMRPI